jgi:hypothetical protein
MFGFDNQSDWTVTDNVLLQNTSPSGPTYYENLFLTSSLQLQDGKHLPIAEPNSLLHTTVAGAAVTRQPGPKADAAFDVTPTPGNIAIMVFDAGFGTVQAGTTFQWDFSDGVTGQGESYTRPFPTGGTYEVTLTVTNPDGTAVRNTAQVKVEGPRLLDLSNAGGITVYDGGTPIVLQSDAVDAEGGLQMDGTGLVAQVNRDLVRSIVESDEFRIAMTLEPDGSGQGGHIMRLHNSFAMAVDKNKLLVDVVLKDGSVVRLMSQNPLDPTEPCEIVFSLTNGVLSLTIDGVLQAEADVGPGMNDALSHDLYFGTPWGQNNYGGSLQNLTIDIHLSDYAEAQAMFETQVEEVTDVPDVAPAPGLPDRVDSIDLIDLHFGKDSVDLIAGGQLAQLPQGYLDPILGEDTFRFSFDLTGEEVGSKGDVMRLEGAFWLKVQSQGELVMWVREDDGDITFLKTSDAELNDLDTSRIDIQLQDDILSIQVDGVVRAATVMDSGISDDVTRDLEFGALSGRETFDGKVSNLTIGLDIVDEVQMMELMALPQFDLGMNVF